MIHLLSKANSTKLVILIDSTIDYTNALIR